mgnify:CR=1 FL=1
MSFTSANKDQILAILGYPITADSMSLIDSKTAKVETASASAVTRVQGYLTELTAIEEELKTARDLPGSAFAQIKQEARRFTSLVSLALSLDIKTDAWS